MPVDPSIISGLKPIQIESPVNALAQLLQVQGAQQQNQLGQMKLDEHSRGIERTNRLQALLGGMKQDAPAEEQVGALTRGGFLTEARTLAESSAKVAKEKRESEKFELEGHLKKFEIAGQIMNGVKDQATWERAKAQTAQAFGPEAAAQLPELYDPALIEQKRAQAMTVKDQLEQVWKQKGYDLDLKQFGEQVRHNKAGEGLTAAGQAITVRGQNMVDARAREANQQPKGQVVQTDDGPMLVDPRSGTAKPVTADGKPLAPKLKSLPAPIQKALLENDASLRKVDKALAAIDAYPASLGASNYLGDTIRQRTDPKGIEARALVADIGSLKIHDRSGAAVTASETPRLKPFIPAATDDPATVKKKLGLFRQEYQAIQSDINNTYTREQGYRAPPTNSAKPGSNIDALLDKYKD